MALSLHVTAEQAEQLMKILPPGSTWPIGPIQELVPQEYHQNIPQSVLKTFVAHCEETRKILHEVLEVDVIMFSQSNQLYAKVEENLMPEVGDRAKRDIHPWILNLLIDWANFDRVITASRGKSEDLEASNSSSIIEEPEPGPPEPDNTCTVKLPIEATQEVVAVQDDPCPVECCRHQTFD